MNINKTYASNADSSQAAGHRATLGGARSKGSGSLPPTTVPASRTAPALEQLAADRRLRNAPVAPAPVPQASATAASGTGAGKGDSHPRAARLTGMTRHCISVNVTDSLVVPPRKASDAAQSETSGRGAANGLARQAHHNL